jgi:hypothetical protein
LGIAALSANLRAPPVNGFSILVFIAIVLAR